MISIFIKNDKIFCDFKGTDNFTDIVATLKKYHCKFNPTSKVWEIPLFRYDDIVEEFQELDAIDMAMSDVQALQNIRDGDSELEISTERLIFKPELLTLPPLVGKLPFENFQKQDITRAINRNRYGFFWDLGTGKSYAKAAIIAHLRHYKKAYKVLLISTSIGAANVAHELRKFIPNLTEEEIFVMSRVGDDRELLKSDKSIVVTNYNTLRHICNYYYDKQHPPKPPKKIKGADGKTKTIKEKRAEYTAPVMPLKEWLENQEGIILLDECHSLSNPSSEQTKKVMSHLKFFKYRYIFSGTPADKNEKLYPLCKILDRALVHQLPYTSWLQEYNKTGNSFSAYAINPEGWKYDKLKELNEKLTKDYVITRKASECLELPPNYIKKLYLSMTAEHRFIYEAFIKATLSDIQTRRGGLISRDVINTFPYLQLALDNPSLLLKNHSDILSPELKALIMKFNFATDHAKVDTLQDIVEDHCKNMKQKGIIWILHPDTAYKLSSLLKPYNPLIIVGETDSRLREGILESFKAKDSPHQLLIASIPVLNTSVTLVEAKFQVYFERVYNYSQYTQSIGRIARVGQDQETRTYIEMYDYSLDVLLDINLQTKDALTNKLTAKDFMDKNEWRRIFNCTELSDFGI